MANYTKEIKTISKLLNLNKGSGTIGIFDSGVGGLSTIKGFIKKSPVKIVYLGDTKNFPYGEKDFNRLSKIILNRIHDLINQGAEKIYIACNTASIIFSQIDKHQQTSELIFSIVNSTANHIVSNSNYRRIGLIGTTYTVLSNSYYQHINALSEDKTRILIQSAEQDLVNYIERGLVSKQHKEVQRICNYFNSLKVDALIMGCTHYAHVKSLLRENLNNNIDLIDPSILLPNSLRLMSTPNPLLGKTVIDFIFTGETPQIAHQYFSL